MALVFPLVAGIGKAQIPALSASAAVNMGVSAHALAGEALAKLKDQGFTI